LDVVAGPNGPQCAVTAAGITSGLAAGCVPWNIFTPGGVTKAAADYIDAPGLNRGKISQTIVNLNATGDLGAYGLKLPTASSGLQVNLGLEYRDEKSFSEPDEEFQTGDLAGQGSATLPVAGGIISHDAFIEARLPLASDLPGAKSVNFDGSYRYSSYTLGYDTNTFSLGLDYAPIQDVRLRGSFSRAVRAPNIVELFSTQSVGLDGQIDPCAGSAPTYSQAACARTGVTPAEYGHILANSAAQYNGLTGGNPNLQPETALTTSIGVGFTPSFLPGFRAQIDYYDIKIENVIETIGADEILTQCLNADLFCSDIHRSAIGSLWLSPSGYVTDLLANVGRLQEKGLDVDFSYAIDLGPAGKLRTGLTGTFINKYEVTPVAALGLSTSYNCAGYYGTACSSTSSGAGNPVSRWRNTVRTTWSTPWDGADLTLTWRYFSPTQLETLSSNPNLTAGAGNTVASGGISNTDARIPSYNYIDLSASVKVAEKVTVRLGCNNVLDKSPPVIGTTDLPGNGNGNTFPGVYDSLGRYFFGQVVAQF
jgi:outer membrane receptor protein involved in Fe transport